MLKKVIALNCLNAHTMLLVQHMASTATCTSTYLLGFLHKFSHCDTADHVEMSSSGNTMAQAGASATSLMQVFCGWDWPRRKSVRFIYVHEKQTPIRVTAGDSLAVKHLPLKYYHQQQPCSGPCCSNAVLPVTALQSSNLHNIQILFCIY
jgi:hypothetical protein